MSGGFYKYRCKYFFTHNCQNWVWVNKAACAECLSEGRDAEQGPAHKAFPQQFSRDVFVPRITDGNIQYTLMEIVASGESGNYWTLRDKAQHAQMHKVTATSDAPNPVVTTAGVHRPN